MISTLQYLQITPNFLLLKHFPPLYTHPPAVFPFLHLALSSRNSKYAIYFFLIHHCTNSLSSLHIFVYHCTFCASLHTKTSPACSASSCKLRHCQLLWSGALLSSCGLKEAL